MAKHSKVMIGLFVVSFAFLASAQLTRTITVTGTIQDSATKSPVAGALVMLIDTTATILTDLPGFIANIGSLKLDSTTTGADGKFSYTMTVSTSNLILGYGVIKQGYQVKFNATGILSTKVDLGTILLAKSDTGSKDTLTVTGTVLDSITNAPVSGALVIMSGLGALDTATGNRVLTNADGTFLKQIIISMLNTAAIVGYVVSQPNYTTKIGEKTATGKQLDLGNILLNPNGPAVLPRSYVGAVEKQPDGMSVYSLAGKLLYDGPVIPIEKITACRNASVLVKFKLKNMIVDSRQVFLTR